MCSKNFLTYLFLIMQLIIANLTAMKREEVDTSNGDTPEQKRQCTLQLVETQGQQTDISQLPAEIIQYIFLFINNEDLSNSSLVCKQWHAIVQDTIKRKNAICALAQKCFDELIIKNKERPEIVTLEFIYSNLAALVLGHPELELLFTQHFLNLCMQNFACFFSKIKQFFTVHDFDILRENLEQQVALKTPAELIIATFETQTRKILMEKVELYLKNISPSPFFQSLLDEFKPEIIECLQPKIEAKVQELVQTLATEIRTIL